MKPDTNPEQEYINYLEPVLSKAAPLYEDKPWTKARNHAIVVAVVAALVSAVAWFYPLSDMQWIWVVVGIALGMALFVSSYFTAVRWTDEKMADEPDYLSPKRKFSPNKRLRMGVIAFVIILAVAAISLSSLPHVLGGIIMVSGALLIYSFVQRTPAEFSAFMNGEVDERDLESEETVQQEQDEARILAEAEEYARLVNSLPEDQRAILLNPRVNGVISVDTEDDKKRQKKKGIIRRITG